MSTRRKLNRAIAQALVDQRFCQALLSQPGLVLKGLGLSEQELGTLHLSAQSLDQLAGQLSGAVHCTVA
ncbi:MAG: hypothetical protein HY335_07095 [Deinococcus sp.]|nr:hypothetical protein [Deinococcus sp.]